MSCWNSNSNSNSNSNGNPSLHGVTNTNKKKKLKGVRRRKWGKWVSEIRVPGTQERLWLGTYSTVEAAAVAHDVAVYCLRKPSSLDKLNFPETLSSYDVFKRVDMSPKSVQKIASDVGMDVDARNIAGKTSTLVVHENSNYENNMVEVSEGSSEYGCREEEALNISVQDYL